MPHPKLTDEILTAALEGYEAQKTRIDAQIAEIRSMLGGGRTDATPKRKVSASARRRMARAQKLRWKKIKQGPEAATEKPKRHMSASARKRIAAAQKKRWAEVKKATVAKKSTRKKSAAAPEQSTTAGA
jgi:hypothetical protein